MITGWQTTSAADLAAIAKKYRGGGFAVTGPEYSAAKSRINQNGFNTASGYQQWAGLPSTGLIDPTTLGSMGIRGASSVSPLAGRGVAGPTGAPGSEQPSFVPPTTSATDGLGVDQFQQTSQKNSMATPPQNSMQRWQNAMGNQEQQGGVRDLSDARRYFWSTGGKSIDARAPQAGYTPAPVTFRGNSQVGTGEPVTFNKTNSDWAPY